MRWSILVALSVSVLGVSACSSKSGEGGEVNPVDIPAKSTSHVVLAWNDLGMHCLNPTYDQAVILPPYNTVWAQVIERGSPPKVVTQDLTISYRLIGNTTSMGKTDALGGNFDQFWANSQALFGVTLQDDTGLNLVDSSLHNGLSGEMVASSDHFEVDGMPVVPVLDDGTWTPYQVAELIVKDGSGTELVRTRATVPTSDELNCAKCHGQGGEATEAISGGGKVVLANILLLHDAKHGTSLADGAPVLCASCHGSPALGATAPGSAGYLSRAVHSLHAEEAEGVTCYDCHPGEKTKCSRSRAHTAANGNCTTCHGSLAEVGDSIARGDRVPWVNEPKCVTCHTGVAQVDTGEVLYRHANGHGGVYCAGCHGSPHAMVPSEQPSDEYQAKQYQNAAKSLGSCGACHATSHGGGAGEFAEEHAGGGGRTSACNVCHVETPSALTSGPHLFQWKSR